MSLANGPACHALIGTLEKPSGLSAIRQRHATIRHLRYQEKSLAYAPFRHEVQRNGSDRVGWTTQQLHQTHVGSTTNLLSRYNSPNIHRRKALAQRLSMSSEELVDHVTEVAVYLHMVEETMVYHSDLKQYEEVESKEPQ